MQNKKVKWPSSASSTERGRRWLIFRISIWNWTPSFRAVIGEPNRSRQSQISLVKINLFFFTWPLAPYWLSLLASWLRAKDVLVGINISRKTHQNFVLQGSEDVQWRQFRESGAIFRSDIVSLVKSTTSVPLTYVVSLGVQLQEDTETDGDTVKVIAGELNFYWN